MPPSILAVANQKGGVGKTTTAVSVGAALADMGRKVLLIDIDPQANATSGLGVDRTRVRTSIYDVIVMGRPLAEARLPTAVPGLDVVPSGLGPRLGGGVQGSRRRGLARLRRCEEIS